MQNACYDTSPVTTLDDNETSNSPLDFVHCLPIQLDNAIDTSGGFKLDPRIRERHWNAFYQRAVCTKTIVWHEAAWTRRCPPPSFLDLCINIQCSRIAHLPTAHTFSVSCTSSTGVSAILLWIPPSAAHIFLSFSASVEAYAVIQALARIANVSGSLRSFSLRWDAYTISTDEAFAVATVLVRLFSVAHVLRSTRFELPAAVEAITGSLLPQSSPSPHQNTPSPRSTSSNSKGKQRASPTNSTPRSPSSVAKGKQRASPTTNYWTGAS